MVQVLQSFHLGSCRVSDFKYIITTCYRISHFATADEFTDTTIRVITIEKRQYGIFKCKAQNKLGSDEGQVELVGKLNTL